MALNLNKAADNFLHIYDNFLSDKWCDIMYQYALEKGRPWGAYVTTDDVLNSEISAEEVLDDDPERAMSLEAVRSYFAQKGAYFLKDDQQRIHGISTRFRYMIFVLIFRTSGCAVWCLSSGATNEVKYHIDYAELYR